MAPVSRPAAQGVAQLALAQALAVLLAATAAALYARWLQPAQLAGWLLALGVARAGVLVLEGGLKTALVRRADLPDTAQLQRLVRMTSWLALAGSAAAAGVAGWLAAQGHLSGDQAWLLAICPAAYFCSHPPLPVALARLERTGRFGVVGRAEGASLLLEFALPAVGLALGLAPVVAFGVAVVLARALRTAWIVRAAAALPAEVALAMPAGAPTPALWRDGASVQAVAGLSMLRDQMHLWLLGPWFGRRLGGYLCPGRHGLRAGRPGTCADGKRAWPCQHCGNVRRPPAGRPCCGRPGCWPCACLPPLLLLPAWLAWADAQAVGRHLGTGPAAVAVDAGAHGGRGGA